MPFTSRRHFLAGLAGAGAALPVLSERAMAQLFKAEAVAAGRSPAALADDEAYWARIQRAFDAERTMINLNNGGISPTPSPVLDQMIRDLRFVNELPVEHNWRVLEPRMESTRRELAREFGCDTEEMAITRNASEGLEIMILGLDLQRRVERHRESGQDRERKLQRDARADQRRAARRDHRAFDVDGGRGHDQELAPAGLARRDGAAH